MASQGACFERGANAWPYVAARFATQPPAPCYTRAATDTVIQYSAVPQLAPQLKGCLADGYPFVFGFTVYESFESPSVAKTGVISMPSATEAAIGGHAVMAVGYDDATQEFLVRNSWGPRWGLGGHFLMPYAYLTDPNLAADFWTIRAVVSD